MISYFSIFEFKKRAITCSAFEAVDFCSALQKLIIFIVLGFIALGLFVTFLVYAWCTWHHERLPVSRLAGYPPTEPIGVDFSYIYTPPAKTNQQQQQ